jgi:hypothetical protein
MAYDQIDPIGDSLHIDHGAALISQIIANANRGKDDKPYELVQFLPPWLQPEKPPQTAADQIAIAAAITAFMGGQDLRKKGA